MVSLCKNALPQPDVHGKKTSPTQCDKHQGNTCVSQRWCRVQGQFIQSEKSAKACRYYSTQRR